MTLIFEHNDEDSETQATTPESGSNIRSLVCLPGQCIQANIASSWLDFHTLRERSIPNGVLAQRGALNPATSSEKVDINMCDRFDNTLIHAVAAQSAGYAILREFINGGAAMNATNTANQSFMHVLNPTTLASTGLLPRFLSKLRMLNFDFSRQDHQGMNILQALLEYPLHHVVLRGVFEALKPSLPLLMCRDDLGRSVRSRLLSLVIWGNWNHDERLKKTAHDLLSRYLGVYPNSYDELSFEIAPLPRSEKSADSLQDTIIQAAKKPGFEDRFGRNGLHCLAQRSYRRPTRASICDQEMPTFDQLLRVGVSATSYDRTGRTPLLVLLYFHDKEVIGADSRLRKSMTSLIKAGASVHCRDRQGENVLHWAVKQGIITATRLLIDQGANVHARNKDGKGVIQMGNETAHRLRRHKNLHIRIMLCIDLVREHGAVDKPDFFQEWDALRR